MNFPIEVESTVPVVLPGDLVPYEAAHEMSATCEEPWTDCKARRRGDENNDDYTPPPGMGIHTNEIVTSLKCGLLWRNPCHPKKHEILNFKKMYIPKVGDLVIGVLTQRTSELYFVDIGGPTTAILSHTSFPMATKRHRPRLEVGCHLLCSVASSTLTTCGEVEVTCVSSDEAKSWSTGETYLGELKDGYLASIPMYRAAMLMSQNVPILDLIGETLQYEVAVGVNGRVWIRTESALATVHIATALEEWRWPLDGDEGMELR